MTNLKVSAHWDDDAKVWWAESDDVIGLVAEAKTLEGLVDDLRDLVPELLTLNHG
jgi:predicted RNase H-like HicB family nuclease